MPATVTIRRWTGSTGSPTKTDITGINTRANTEDAHTTAGTTNPIQIPASGTNYSFWVSTRLSCDAAPTTAINNIKWYTDGTNNFSTNSSVNCKVSAGASTYVQATGTVGTTGTPLTSGAYTGVGTPADAFASTSASPLSVTGSIANTTGDFGNFVVYQLEVGTTASPGVTGSETFTWRYDET